MFRCRPYEWVLWLCLEMYRYHKRGRYRYRYRYSIFFWCRYRYRYRYRYFYYYLNIINKCRISEKIWFAFVAIVLRIAFKYEDNLTDLIMKFKVFMNCSYVQKISYLFEFSKSPLSQLLGIAFPWFPVHSIFHSNSVCNWLCLRFCLLYTSDAADE